MRQLFYRIIYFPPINLLLRNTARLVNKLSGAKISFPVTGKVTFQTLSKKQFNLYTNESNFVSYYLYWNGVEKYEFTELFCEVIKECDSFVDIGSNIGLYSVLAGIENDKIRIDSFDPAPSAYLYTKMSLEANKLKNAHCHQLAVSNSVEKGKFNEVVLKKYPYLKHHLSGASSLKDSFIETGKLYDVQITTLDTFVDEMKLTSLDFLKVDAERVEMEILLGGKKSILKFNPIIVCEIYQDIINEIAPLIDELNYTIYNVKNGRLILVNDVRTYEYGDNHDFFMIPPHRLSLFKNFVLGN